MGANKSSASASMIHFTPVSQMCLQLLVRGEKQCILNQRKCALMNSVYFREVLTCNKRWFLEAWEGKWVTMEIYSDLCCVWRCGGVIFFKHMLHFIVHLNNLSMSGTILWQNVFVVLWYCITETEYWGINQQNKSLCHTWFWLVKYFGIVTAKLCNWLLYQISQQSNFLDQ